MCGSALGDKHVDREELRRSPFGRRSTHHLSHCRTKPLLHEALKVLTGLPDVVDVETLLPLARTVQDQTLRSLVGPHRDEVLLLVDGEEAGVAASSGQARSLLLALALATLEVYRQETGSAAVALLDDLDSELDEARATELCREVSRRGQALVTTAHAGWARRLADGGRLFEVEAGEVRAA